MSDYRVNQAAEKRPFAFRSQTSTSVVGRWEILCISESYEGATRCIFHQLFFYSPGHTPVCRRLSRGTRDGKSGLYAISQDIGGVPKGLFGAPKSLFGIPKNSFGVPKSSFGIPESSFGAPKGLFGAPNNSFGAPKNSFGTPKNSFGAPKNLYGQSEDFLKIQYITHFIHFKTGDIYAES
jgi:hypothetical protein